MAAQKNNTLHTHITSVKKGERAFENAFQSVSRMILGQKIDKVMVNADDPALRANRLALLGQLHAAMNRVADLSKLAA